MRAISPTPVSTSHTRAWLAFEQNLDSISHTVYLGTREIRLAKAEATRFKTFLDKFADPRTKANPAKLLRSLQRFSKTFQTRIERYGTISLWRVVMLVTCVLSSVSPFASRRRASSMAV